MSDLLEVLIGKTKVGKLTLLSGDRSFFTFDEFYLQTTDKPVLSQSFITRSGELITESKITQTKLPAFFSNLLPEGHLRKYLADRAGISSAREFKLISLLGEDLPGAVIIKPIEESTGKYESQIHHDKASELTPYRFSLAGVQLKFSALVESTGGLSIPASGIGGNWIVKLPAQNFAFVPENEWAMLHLANDVGICVPENRLVNLDQIQGLPELGVLAGDQALVVKRFDRSLEGKRIHIEDFAQVYSVYPDAKYSKVSYANISNMLWTLLGEEGLIDFIKRLVFSIMIGNGDMHLKNWSLIYSDGINPELAPAYDYVSTIPYIPNDKLALSLVGSKSFHEITMEHFKKLARKSDLPEYLVVQSVKDIASAVRETWSRQQNHYSLPKEIITRINKHIHGISL